MKKLIFLIFLLLLSGVTILNAQADPSQSATEELKKEIAARQERIELKKKLLQLQKEESELDAQLKGTGSTPAADNSTASGTPEVKPLPPAETTGKGAGEEIKPGAVEVISPGSGLVKTNLTVSDAVKPPAAQPLIPPAAAAIAPAVPPAAALQNAAVPGTGDLCFDAGINPANYSRLQHTICDLARDIVNGKRTTPANPAPLPLLTQQSKIARFLIAKVTAADTANANIADFLIKAERERTDVQQGADAKTAGSTSLVVKGGVPEFLSWAMENGGIEGSRDGNTLTFRANPLGLAETLLKRNYIDQLQYASLLKQYIPTAAAARILFREDDAFTRALRKTSIGLSFDLSRSDNVFTGTRQQLSAVSVRYNFINKRDPLDEKYRNDWDAFARTDLVEFGNIANTALNNLIGIGADGSTTFFNADLNAWFVNLRKAVRDVDMTTPGANEATEAVRKVIELEIAKIPVAKLKADATVVAALNSLGMASVSYVDKKNQLLKKISQGEVATFEYTNYREVNAPDLSNFRAIVSKGFWDGGDVIFNASLTMFNKKPAVVPGTATINRLRDFDFSLQLEQKFHLFAADSMLGNPILSFAGKYKRLNSDTVLGNGMVQPNSRGDVAYGQIKLVVPLYFNGLRFNLPFSVSFANRTEFIKEKHIQGNFGFTFDINPFINGLRSRLLSGFLGQ